MRWAGRLRRRRAGGVNYKQGIMFNLNFLIMRLPEMMVRSIVSIGKGLLLQRSKINSGGRA